VLLLTQNAWSPEDSSEDIGDLPERLVGHVVFN
jgi:hypothetical protein